MDFLISASDQLVNHLDKIEKLSDGEFKPKVIIRTSVGSKTPINPGLQHVGDYSKEIRSMCKNIKVIELYSSELIAKSYKNALESDKSTILVEYGELYDNVPIR
jgi:pyruvate/2-oxoglutarate/acetoin dehydrogenase E1 component